MALSGGGMGGAQIFKLVATIQTNAAMAVRDINAVNTAGKRLSVGMQRSFAAISKVAKVAFVVAGIAAAGMFVAAIKKAAGFERAMAMVKAVTGATVEEFDALTKEAKRLGLETAQTMTDIAAGMEALARAGFETDEIIAAMGGVVALAESQLMDLGRASQIVANVLNAMGLQATEADRVVNLFAATAASADVTVEDLAESFKYFAPIAAQFNIPLEEAAAIMGVLGDNGLKGSMATTALSTAMLRLAAPSEEAEDIMKKLNIQVWDAQGNFIGFTEMIGHLDERMAGLTMQQKAATMATLFGARAYKQIAPLLKSGAKLIRDYTKEITGTNAAFDQQAEMLDTVAGQWDILKGSIELLLVTIGGPMLEAIQAFLEDTLIPWINYMTDAAEGTSVFETAMNKLLTPFRWMIENGESLRKAFIAISIGLGAIIVLNVAQWVSKVGLAFAALSPAVLVALTAIATAYAAFKAGEAIVEGLAGGVELIADELEELAKTFVPVEARMDDVTAAAAEMQRRYDLLMLSLKYGQEIIGLNGEQLAELEEEITRIYAAMEDAPDVETALLQWNRMVEELLTRWGGDFPQLLRLLGRTVDEITDTVITGYEQMLVDILSGQIFIQEAVRKTGEELKPIVDLQRLFSDEYDRLVKMGAPEEMIQGLIRVAEGFNIIIEHEEDMLTFMEIMQDAWTDLADLIGDTLGKMLRGIGDYFRDKEQTAKDHNQNMRDIHEDYEGQTADRVTSYQDALADAELDYQRKKEDLQRDHGRRLADIGWDDADRRAQIENSFQQRMEDAAIDYARRRTDLETDYTDDIEQLALDREGAIEDEIEAYEDSVQPILQALWEIVSAALAAAREELWILAAVETAKAMAYSAAEALGALWAIPLAAQHWAAAGVAALEAGALSLGGWLTGFKKGALFDQPTLLPPHMVGEGGASEAYLPLTPQVLGDIGAGIVDALSGSQEPMLAAEGGVTLNMEIHGPWYIREDADVELVSRALADEIDDRLTGRGLGRF